MDLKSALGANTVWVALCPVAIQVTLADVTIPIQHIRVELWSNAPLSEEQLRYPDQWHSIPTTCVDPLLYTFVACFIPVVPGTFEYTARYVDTRCDAIVWAATFGDNASFTVLRRTIAPVLPSTPAEVERLHKFFVANFVHVIQPTAAQALAAVIRAYLGALLQFVTSKSPKIEDTVITALPYVLAQGRMADMQPIMRRVIAWFINDICVVSVLLTSLQSIALLCVRPASEDAIAAWLPTCEPDNRSLEATKPTPFVRSNSARVLLAVACAASVPPADCLETYAATMSSCGAFATVLETDLAMFKFLRPLPPSTGLLELLVQQCSTWTPEHLSYSFTSALVERLQIHTSAAANLYLRQILSGMYTAAPVLSRSRSQGAVLNLNVTTEQLLLRVAQALCTACDRFIAAAQTHLDMCILGESISTAGMDDNPFCYRQPTLMPIIMYMTDIITSLANSDQVNSVACTNLVNALSRCVTKCSNTTSVEYGIILRAVMCACEAHMDVRCAIVYRIIRNWPNDDSEKMSQLLQFIASLLPALLVAFNSKRASSPSSSRTDLSSMAPTSVSDSIRASPAALMLIPAPVKPSGPAAPQFRIPTVTQLVPLIVSRLVRCAENPHPRVASIAQAIVGSIPRSLIEAPSMPTTALRTMPSEVTSGLCAAVTVM